MHDLYPSKAALEHSSGSTGGLDETFNQLDELLAAQGADDVDGVATRSVARQQGDPEGPESSQGVDPEPGRPTDKVPKPTGADTKAPARERSSPAAGDDQVNTGGLPGPDNSD